MTSNDNTTWYVCHGGDAVHFSKIEEGSAITSGQPNIEKFDTKEEAVARATALGYVFETDESES